MEKKEHKMTIRERRLEEIRKRDEAERGQKFRQHLVRVKIITRPFTVLHGIPIFYCGYCGKPMALFSSKLIQIGKRLPPLFYACRARCSRSGYQRAEFIDKMLLQLIQRRIKSIFPEPENKGDYEALLDKFKLLDELQSNRLEMLGKMHYASYKKDEVLKELKKAKNRIDKIQNEIHSLFSSGASENPLMYPLFATPMNELDKLDLAYRRELVKLTIYRIRYFNEFLITRMIPLTEEEKAIDDKMGKVFNINLKVTDRSSKTELPTPEELEQSKIDDIEPFPEREIELPDEIPDDVEIEYE